MHIKPNLSQKEKPMKSNYEVVDSNPQISLEEKSFQEIDTESQLFPYSIV